MSETDVGGVFCKKKTKLLFGSLQGKLYFCTRQKAECNKRQTINKQKQFEIVQ